MGFCKIYNVSSRFPKVLHGLERSAKVQGFVGSVSFLEVSEVL